MTRKTDEAKRELRRAKVIANLSAGLSYRQMAEALGVSIGTIKNDVAIVLGRLRKNTIQDAAQHIQVQVRRLDIALNAIWGKVLDGDLKAIATMIKIEERRSKLLGLDQPEKVQHSGSVDRPQADPLEGLDVDARRGLIDNLIRARSARAAASARGNADGASDDGRSEGGE